VGAGVVGTDRTLLEFVRELLKENGIKSSIQLPIKKGKRVVIWGKEYFAKKNVYFLNLSGIKNSELFLKKIGFSFPRKHEKLREAIEIKKKYSDSDALTEWKNRYFKASREWVRRSEADSGGSPETSS
jgi:intein-encoded DNA endonuclease-like protein